FFGDSVHAGIPKQFVVDPIKTKINELTMSTTFFRNSNTWMYCLLILLIFNGCLNQPKKMQEKPYNVLLIPVDDLNDWLGFMGNQQVITPNFDELASRGVYFTSAYCAAPLCSPSRASIWTGQYPFNTGLYSNNDALESRKDLPTMLDFFKGEGYTILGGGKLFHGRSEYTNSLFNVLGPGTGISGGP